MIDEFEGKIIAEKYRIESILRDSDLGTFYRAWHVLMDRPVTVKILSPALAIDQRLVDRFLAEAKTLSHVSHPNILNITDFGTDPRGTTYAVYEGAAGVTLENLVGQSKTLQLAHALNIATQAASALDAAHTAGLVHGTLCPEKILVSSDADHETVKVFDFGAEPVGRNSKVDINYLSPEQYADFGNVDARSDIYSLGITLYEMLAGAVPFTGKNTAELKAKLDSEPPTPLATFRDDLPADVEPLILSAIAADPARRYQTMRAFAEDLERVSGGVSTPKKAKAAVGKRNIWQTAFIVLAGISLLAVALIYATSVKRTDPTTTLQADIGYLPVQPIGPATGAQEESLAKLPAMTEAEMMSAANSNTALPVDSLPGGDGYNAWANGAAPPAGAPTAQYIPPGGQYYTIDPNNPNSQFMPPDGAVVLVPVPVNSNTAIKPSPTPKTAPANTAVKATPQPAASPKQTAAPKPDKPADAQPKAAATGKPGKTGREQEP